MRHDCKAMGRYECLKANKMLSAQIVEEFMDSNVISRKQELQITIQIEK